MSKHIIGVAFSSLLMTASVALAEQGQTAKPAPPAATSKSAPSQPAGMAVPADYVIGAEDVLGVVFWREQEMSGDLTVRPDGMITLPLIGDVKAAGLKPEVLSGIIQTAAGKYLTDPNVTITVRQANSRKVFITGQVMMSGSHPLTGPRTVLQLITLAGGLTEYADSENISIMREEQGKTRYFRFNYKEVSKGKKLEQNILLQPGDTVVVP